MLCHSSINTMRIAADSKKLSARVRLSAEDSPSRWSAAEASPSRWSASSPSLCATVSSRREILVYALVNWQALLFCIYHESYSSQTTQPRFMSSPKQNKSCCTFHPECRFRSVKSRAPAADTVFLHLSQSRVGAFLSFVQELACQNSHSPY